MANRRKILIVDNDENIAELISLYLEKECYETRIETDGQKALDAFPVWQPDLIILDLMLPVRDGYDVCREIRRTSRVPIIILSAKTEIFDKVLGLELGADDYMIKPFDCKELVARIKAILRRSSESGSASAEQGTGSEGSSAKIKRFPNLEINLTNYTVTYRGKVLEMPPKEIELLYFLASSPDQVFTREQLLRDIWGYDFVGDTRTVDVHIKRLREKLDGSPDWSIATVWGVGYKFSLLAASS